MQSFTVGRSEQANIQIDNDSVSRMHLRVTVLNEQMCDIEDLGSANGTFIERDGERHAVRRAEVSLQQRLILGTYPIRLAELVAVYQQARPVGPDAAAATPVAPDNAGAARQARGQQPFSRYIRSEDGRYIRKDS